MAFLASLRSTIAYQTNGSAVSTGSVYQAISGVPVWTNTLVSSMVSVGSSTNQSYINLAQGNFSTASSWVSTLNTASTIKFVSMSGNAQTQLAVSQVSTISSLYYTSTLGTSWATLSGATGLPLATQTNYSSGAVSGDGRYQILGTTSRVVSTSGAGGGMCGFISNNYGASYVSTLINTPYIYLPFENSTADVYGHTVTVLGTFTYTTGVIGLSAAIFNNPAGGTATNNVLVAWPGSANFTISGWFYPTGFGSGGNTPVFFGAYSGAVAAYINNNGTVTAGMPTGGAGGTTTIGTSSAITVNTWNNFVYIFQTNGVCSFYLNNILIGSVTNTGGVGTYTTSSIAFGSGQAGNVAFAGYMDDLRLYNNAFAYPMNYNNVAVSNSGQYMLATVANGGLFMSSNSGSTWSQVTSELLAANWLSLAISATGQYMLAYSDPVTVTPQLTGLGSNSWTVNGINWTASASSNFSANWPAYGAFHNYYGSILPYSWASINNYSGTGVYQGGISTSIIGVGSRSGEWLQIQSSIPIVMHSYTFACAAFIGLPQTYWIVGSTDGTNWYPIQNAIMASNPLNTNFTTCTSYLLANYNGTQTITGTTTVNVTTTNYSTSGNAYTYFRILCTIGFNPSSTSFELGEWYINFNAGGQAYSTNFGSTWQNGYALATPLALSLSGSGQYAIGANTLQLISELNFENNYTDSTGLSYLSNPTTVTGTNALAFSSSIYKVGAYSLFVNNNGQANFSYQNYTLSSFFNGPTALSISIWFYPTTLPGNQTVIYGFNNVGNTPGTYLYILNNSLTLAYYTTTGIAGVIACGSITVNTWNHAVIIFSYGVLTTYLNAVFQSSILYTGTPSLNGGVVPTRFTVGNLYSAGKFGEGYSGYIDDIRLYNQALTAVQINSIYTVPTYSGVNTISNYLTGFGSGTYGTPAFSPELIITNIPVASAISTTGQYMVLVTNGTTNVYYSINYGSTFTGLTIGSTAMTTCAISADGSYITVSNGTTVYQLNNNSNGFSLALGNKAGQQNQGQNAIAIGNFAGQINQSANSIILNATGSALTSCGQGFYVTPITQYTASPSATFGLLGYGTDNQIVHSGIIINSSGYVGIGRTNSEYPLDVYGGTRLMSNVTDTSVLSTTNSLNIVRYNAPGSWSANGGMLMFSNTYASNSNTIVATGGISGLQTTNGSFGGGLQFWYASGGTLSVGMTMNSSITFYTSIYPATDNLYSVGSGSNRFTAVFAVNGTIQTSDSSEKDLTILPYGLTELMQMKTIMYKWKSQASLPDTDPAKNYQYYGVCADQLSAIFPELVYNEDPSVPMQLNYSEIIPVVIKAVQEQNIIVKEQATEITALQSQLTKVLSPYAVGGVLDLYKITDSIIAKNTLLETTVKQQAIEITALQTQLTQVLQRLSAAGIA